MQKIIHKILFMLVVLLCIATASRSYAQGDYTPRYVLDANGNVVEVTMPVMTFEKTSYEFGDVPEGMPAKYEFKFTNTGSDPLIISNVKASCGCTTPFYSSAPIMPGEESRISVVFDTVGRPGTFYKSITITANTFEPMTHLIITGKVITPPIATENTKEN